LSRLQILDVDEAIAARYGVLKADLQRQGQVIADFDLLIAATALVHGLKLVTHNRRDFERIPGLVLDDWLR
jgi:tRNA(fMet)-specific endonuclease VapC